MTFQDSHGESFYTVLSKGVLALKSNVRDFGWSFGLNAPASSPLDYAQCMVRIRLLVQPSRAFEELDRRRREQKWGKYHFLFGKPGEQLVFYRRPFVLGSKLYLEASNLVGGEPLIRVNQNYFRFVQFRFMNLHSVSYILTDLAALLLLQKQLTPIHCSAFKKNGRTVVVFAPSNTGKTLATMMACMNQEAEFISEDMAITDGQQIYALPWTSTFRYYANVETGWWPRLLQWATHALPFLELFPLVNNRPITDYVPEERICHRSTVTHLVILERGSSSVIHESHATVFNKVLNLNRAEFNYHRSLVNNAYEFFNPELDIAAAYETERVILRRLVENAHECLVVCTDNPLDYADMVLNAIA